MAFSKKVSVMTFNIFEMKCKYFSEFDKIVDKKPDILLTQENGLFIGTENYSLINKCVHVGTYQNKLDINAKANFIHCINTPSYLAKSDSRQGVIIEYNDITIANTHLEGGRVVDQVIHTNFDGYMVHKLNILKQLIELNPDIICGDFNSYYDDEYNTDSLPFIHQRKWFDSLNGGELTDEQIIEWNRKPYDILRENGYVYAMPMNCDNNITNIRGNTVIDTIWYKPDKLTPIYCKIMDLRTHEYSHKIIPDNCVSDHFPVFCEFQIL